MNKIKCILLVDDDETTNFVNQMLLEDLGISEKVLVANNGQEALHMVEQEGKNQCYPDLILLDINMPVMNGFEFLKEYNQLDTKFKHAIINVLTTSLNPKDLDRLQHMPIHGFLNKPLTKEMVEELIKEHFSEE